MKAGHFSAKIPGQLSTEINNQTFRKVRNPADYKDFWEQFGWGTWIRTRTNGVRVL
jgi:hypothetical protein